MGRIKYLEAIGQKPKRGRPSAGPAPSKTDLVRLYIEEERSVRDVANALGCSKDMVHRALKKFGIKVRANARRSKLRIIPLPDLESAIRVKGIRGTAREMGIDKGTIRHHLKVRKAENGMGK